MFKRLVSKYTFSFFILLASLFAFTVGYYSQQFTKIQKLSSVDLNSEIIGKLYLEYCIIKVPDRNKCIFTTPFIKLKKMRKEFYQVNFAPVQKKMGDGYLSTQHYLDFFRKVLEHHEDIKLLESYSEFVEIEKGFEGKRESFYENENIFSKDHLDFVSYLNSFTFYVNSWHFIFIFLYLIILLPLLEGKMTTFPMGIFTGLTIVLNYILLPFESFTYKLDFILVSYILVYFLLGFSLTYLKRFRFYSTRLSMSLVLICLFVVIELINFMVNALYMPYRLMFMSLIMGCLLGYVVQMILNKKYQLSSIADLVLYFKIPELSESQKLFAYQKLLKNNLDNITLRLQILSEVERDHLEEAQENRSILLELLMINSHARNFDQVELTKIARFLNRPGIKEHLKEILHRCEPHFLMALYSNVNHREDSKELLEAINLNLKENEKESHTSQD